MDQCKLCGTFIPMGDRYCSPVCRKLDITPRKVLFFGAVLVLGALVSLFVTVHQWPLR